MAFNKTSQTARLLNVIGAKCEMVCGMSTLSGGAATATVPPLKRVDGAMVTAQSANAANVTATSGNTFTIAGTGTDVVMWIAWGQPRL